MELSKEKLESKKMGPEVEYYYLGMEKEGNTRTHALMAFMYQPATIPSPHCHPCIFPCGSAHPQGQRGSIPATEMKPPQAKNEHWA